MWSELPQNAIFSLHSDLRIAKMTSELPGIAYELPIELPNCRPNCWPNCCVMSGAVQLCVRACMCGSGRPGRPSRPGQVGRVGRVGRIESVGSAGSGRPGRVGRSVRVGRVVSTWSDSPRPASPRPAPPYPFLAMSTGPRHVKFEFEEKPLPV